MTTETSSGYQDSDLSKYYQIEFRGRLSRRWVDWFGSLRVIHQTDESGDPLSTIIIKTADQSALLGILQKMHSLGFSLLEIKQINELDSDKRSFE